MPDGVFVSFEGRGYRWRSLPELRQCIEGDARFTECAASQMVKEGLARRIWRLEVVAGDAPIGAYVKECLLPTWRDRVKYLFQPSKAEREFAALRELRRLGVPVPEPLAVGVRRRGLFLDRSIIVTRALPDVQPLDRYILEHLGRVSHAEVGVFTRDFARFLDTVHGAGLFHRDFHGANILVRGEPAAAEFSIVDLDDVTIGGPLSYGERIDNLAIVGRFFCQVVPRHWRFRFLSAYCGDAQTAESAARTVERNAARGMRAVWTAKDRRICGNNKYFLHVTVGRLTGHMRRTAEAKDALKLLQRGDPFGGAEIILKDSRSSTVGVFKLSDDAGGMRVVIKRRNQRSGWKRFLDPLRASRAMRGFFAGAAFEHRCLPTPRVLAALDCRRLGCLPASYLVLEHVNGAENLAAVIAAGQASPLFQRISADKAGFLRRLAHLLRRMHFCGFSMRDLKAANILVYAVDGAVEIMIGDLDDIRLYSVEVPERRAIRNLARLYADALLYGAFGRREAVDFLKQYLGPCQRERLAYWMREIQRLAGAIGPGLG